MSAQPVTCNEQDLRTVIEQNPRLCVWGWWNPIQGRQMKIDLEGNRESLKLCFDEFRRSVEWLSQCETTKTVRPQSPSSYNLKHRAEKATGDYISNGALIAAALHLGITVKGSDETPNPGIGISVNCPVYQAASSG